LAPLEFSWLLFDSDDIMQANVIHWFLCCSTVTCYYFNMKPFYGNSTLFLSLSRSTSHLSHQHETIEGKHLPSLDSLNNIF
jgi:hypothetical protein